MSAPSPYRTEVAQLPSEKARNIRANLSRFSEDESYTPLSAVAADLEEARHTSSTDTSASLHASARLSKPRTSSHAQRLPTVPLPAFTRQTDTTPELNCQRVNVYARVRPFIAEDGLEAVCTRLQLAPAAGAVVVLPVKPLLSTLPHAAGHGVKGGKPPALSQADLSAAKRFDLDGVFGAECAQSDVYRSTASPCVLEVLSGVNAVCCVYGQTGAGKSFTVFGPSEAGVHEVAAQDASLLGLIPRTMHDLYERMAVRSRDTGDRRLKYAVTVRYLQLYQDTWVDLLSPALPQNGSRSVDRPLTPDRATLLECPDVRAVMSLLGRGSKRKAMAAHAMNSNSSRGHTIFQAVVTRLAAEDDGVGGGGGGYRSYEEVGSASLTFLDLAGSERVSRTGADGVLLTEARYINKSLHTLGVCMAAVASSALQHTIRAGMREEEEGGESYPPLAPAFVPWRSSKLTRFLQSCLAQAPAAPAAAHCVPSSLTLIVCCSPTDRSVPETLSSLLFANRARALAEAMAGETEDARELLRDQGSTGARSALFGASAALGSTSALGSRGSTATTRTSAPTEVDAVLDAQRTQISALQAQYSALQGEYEELRRAMRSERETLLREEEARIRAVQEEERAKLAVERAQLLAGMQAQLEREIQAKAQAVEAEVRAKAAESLKEQQSALLSELESVQRAYEAQMAWEDAAQATRIGSGQRDSVAGKGSRRPSTAHSSVGDEIARLRAQLERAERAAVEAQEQSRGLAQEAEKMREHERWTAQMALSALAGFASSGHLSTRSTMRDGAGTPQVGSLPSRPWPSQSAPLTERHYSSLSASTLELESILASAVATGDSAALAAAVEGAVSYVARAQRQGVSTAAVLPAPPSVAGAGSPDSLVPLTSPHARDNLMDITVMPLTPAGLVRESGGQTHSAAVQAEANPVVHADEQQPVSSGEAAGPDSCISLTDLADAPLSPLLQHTPPRTTSASHTHSPLPQPQLDSMPIVAGNDTHKVEDQKDGIGTSASEDMPALDAGGHSSPVQEQQVPEATVPSLGAGVNSVESDDIERDEALAALQAAMERAQAVLLSKGARLGGVKSRVGTGGAASTPLTDAPSPPPTVVAAPLPSAALQQPGQGVRGGGVEGPKGGYRSRSSSIASVSSTSIMREQVAAGGGMAVFRDRESSGSGGSAMLSTAPPPTLASMPAWQPHVPMAQAGTLPQTASPQAKPRPVHGPVLFTDPFAATPSSRRPSLAEPAPMPGIHASDGPLGEGGTPAIEPEHAGVHSPQAMGTPPHEKDRAGGGEIAVPREESASEGVLDADDSVPSAPTSPQPLPLPSPVSTAAEGVAEQVGRAGEEEEVPQPEPREASADTHAGEVAPSPVYSGPPAPTHSALISTTSPEAAPVTSGVAQVVVESSSTVDEPIRPATAGATALSPPPSLAPAVEADVSLGSPTGHFFLSPDPTPTPAPAVVGQGRRRRPVEALDASPPQATVVDPVVIDRVEGQVPPSSGTSTPYATGGGYKIRPLQSGAAQPLVQMARVDHLLPSKPLVMPAVAALSQAVADDGDELTRAILSTRQALARALTAVQHAQAQTEVAGATTTVTAGPASGASHGARVEAGTSPVRMGSSLGSPGDAGRKRTVARSRSPSPTPTPGKGSKSVTFQFSTDGIRSPPRLPVSAATVASGSIDLPSSRVALYKSFMSGLPARTAEGILTEARAKAAAIVAGLQESASPMRTVAVSGRSLHGSGRTEEVEPSPAAAASTTSSTGGSAGAMPSHMSTPAAPLPAPTQAPQEPIPRPPPAGDAMSIETNTSSSSSSSNAHEARALPPAPMQPQPSAATSAGTGSRLQRAGTILGPGVAPQPASIYRSPSPSSLGPVRSEYGTMTVPLPSRPSSAPAHRGSVSTDHGGAGVQPPRQPTPSSQDKPDLPRGPSGEPDELVSVHTPSVAGAAALQASSLGASSSTSQRPQGGRGRRSPSPAPVAAAAATPQRMHVNVPADVAAPGTPADGAFLPVYTPGVGVVLLNTSMLAAMGVRVSGDMAQGVQVEGIEGEVLPPPPPPPPKSTKKRAGSSGRKEGWTGGTGPGRGMPSPLPIPTVTLATVGTVGPGSRPLPSLGQLAGMTTSAV